MKKLILALAVLTLTSTFAQSEEAEPELMEAPNSYVLSILTQCKSFAVEDEVAETEMKNYLLTCINDELEESGYKLIKVLPKEE